MSSDLTIDSEYDVYSDFMLAPPSITVIGMGAKLLGVIFPKFVQKWNSES